MVMGRYLRVVIRQIMNVKNWGRVWGEFRGCVDISSLSPFAITGETPGATKRGCGWWSHVATLNVEVLNRGLTGIWLGPTLWTHRYSFMLKAHMPAGPYFEIDGCQ